MISSIEEYARATNKQRHQSFSQRIPEEVFRGSFTNPWETLIPFCEAILIMSISSPKHEESIHNLIGLEEEHQLALKELIEVGMSPVFGGATNSTVESIHSPGLLDESELDTDLNDFYGSNKMLEKMKNELEVSEREKADLINQLHHVEQLHTNLRFVFVICK